MEIKIHNFQITGNDFNGFINLCFGNVCNFFRNFLVFFAFLVRSDGLI